MTKNLFFTAISLCQKMVLTSLRQWMCLGGGVLCTSKELLRDNFRFRLIILFFAEDKDLFN